MHWSIHRQEKDKLTYLPSSLCLINLTLLFVLQILCARSIKKNSFSIHSERKLCACMFVFIIILLFSFFNKITLLLLLLLPLSKEFQHSKWRDRRNTEKEREIINVMESTWHKTLELCYLMLLMSLMMMMISCLIAVACWIVCSNVLNCIQRERDARWNFVRYRLKRQFNSLKMMRWNVP